MALLPLLKASPRYNLRLDLAAADRPFPAEKHCLGGHSLHERLGEVVGEPRKGGAGSQVDDLERGEPQPHPGLARDASKVRDLTPMRLHLKSRRRPQEEQEHHSLKGLLRATDQCQEVIHIGRAFNAEGVREPNQDRIIPHVP